MRTEVALVTVMSDFLLALHEGHLAILIMMVFLAAFDMIDHGLLLQHYGLFNTRKF